MALIKCPECTREVSDKAVGSKLLRKCGKRTSVTGWAYGTSETS